MKKFYLSIVALAFGATAIAQQSIIKQEVATAVTKGVLPSIPNGMAADPTDTIGFDELGASLILYSTATGYVFGTNDLVNPANPAQHQYNLEYSRGFIINDPYTVIGAAFIFGAKENVSGNPAAAKAKLYSLAPNKAYDNAQATSPTAIGPNQVLASANLAFADMDTLFPSLSFVNFTTAAWVATDFGIGLEIAPLYGNPADTIALLADENGDSDGDYTWTKLGLSYAPGAPGIWFKTTATLQGGLDVNLAIFAVVAESPSSIEEQGFLNGVKMTSYPNPATADANVTVQFGLETAAKNVDINIYSLGGQLVHNAALGAKASGIHTMNVAAGTLSAGSYIYTIDADGRRMAKTMEILK